MTENQEKEVFLLLNTIVTQVQGVQSDVKEIKSDVQVLKSDVQEIRQTLDEHSQILNRLDAKTDNIAETDMRHDKRLASVEKEVGELRDGIH